MDSSGDVALVDREALVSLASSLREQIEKLARLQVRRESIEEELEILYSSDRLRRRSHFLRLRNPILIDLWREQAVCLNEIDETMTLFDRRRRALTDYLRQVEDGTPDVPDAGCAEIAANLEGFLLAYERAEEPPSNEAVRGVLAAAVLLRASIENAINDAAEGVDAPESAPAPATSEQRRAELERLADLVMETSGPAQEYRRQRGRSHGTPLRVIAAPDSEGVRGPAAPRAPQKGPGGPAGSL